MVKQIFIGRTHEITLLEKAFKPSGISHRSMLFIIGPSGIGKTATTLHILENLRRKHGILTIYLDFSKAYSSIGEAVLDLIKQFREQAKEYKGFPQRFLIG